VIRSSEWARQDLHARSQEEIGQLVKRISHLDAQNDERSDHQIEAEMHRRRWTKCFLQPRVSFRESQKNRTQFLLVMTTALLSRVGFVVNDFRASWFLSPHDWLFSATPVANGEMLRSRPRGVLWGDRIWFSVEEIN
jgi:hypothetical protein